VRLLYGGRATFGRDVAIGARALVMSRHEFALGDRVRIGPDFTCHVNLHVGPGTLISGRVALVGDDHAIDAREDVFAVPRSGECAVVMEGDNLIGFGAIIVGACRIGRGAVVGAGSVVTGDLEPDTVYAGVPARALRARRRGEETQDGESAHG
jgi:acetyltransferase-like isoleucine patch superfamily enzyme